jgi:hypothetical protein
LCCAALGQGSSGGKTGLLTDSERAHLVGRMTSASYRLELSAAPLAGAQAQSASYRLASGLAFALGASDGSRAQVFGVLPPTGLAQGGDALTIAGRNLNGSTLLIGGQAVAQTGSTSIGVQVLAPNGVGPFTNPKGAVAALAIGTNGTSSLDAAYTYQPAVRPLTALRVGRPVVWASSGETAFFSLLLLDISATSVPVQGFFPIPGVSGALELTLAYVPLSNQFLLVSDLSAPVSAPVPLNGALVGRSLSVQGVNLTAVASQLVAAFTNKLDQTFLP